MPTRCRWLLSLALALASAGVARAEPKDVADLFPAQTLAYAEFRQADRLAREAAALLKGSAFEDLPAVAARFRAKHDTNDYFYGGYELNSLGFYLSPEMIVDMGRLQGGAVALTGFAKDKSPEATGVLLTGDSTVFPLIMRSSLIFGSVRVVGTVEGVDLYRQRRVIYAPSGPGDKPPPPKAEDVGPIMAMAPGALIMGSSVEGVTDVLRRLKGKSGDPALSSRTAFKDAAKLRDRPGFFGYVDAEALAGQMDRLAGSPGYLPAKEWKAFKAAVNPAAFRTLIAALSVQNGGGELTVRAQLNDKEKSPLLALLPDKAADVEGLRLAPGDSLVAATFPIADGAKLCDAVVALLDAAAAAEDGASPGKALAAQEGKWGFRLGKDVLGKVRGATAAILDAGDDVAGVEEVPLLILTAADGEAATYLAETALPKVLASFLGDGDASAEVKKHEVLGQKLHSVAGRGMALHFGRKGSAVVIGARSEKRVAEALGADDKKVGLLARKDAAAAFADLDKGPVVGLALPGQAMVEMLKAAETPTTVIKPAFPKGGPDDKPRPDPRPAGPPKLSEESAKVVKEFRAAAEPLPPLAFTLTRKADVVSLEARAATLRGPATKVIDLWVSAALERSIRRDRGFGDATPPPDTKPDPKPVDKDAAKKDAEEARARAEEALRRAEAERAARRAAEDALDKERRAREEAKKKP